MGRIPLDSLSMMFSENRSPRIKSEGKLFGIMREGRTAP